MYLLNYIYFAIITLLGAKFLFQHQGKVKHPLHKKKYLIFDGTELFWVLTFSTGLLAFSAPGALDLMAIRLMALEVLCFIGLFIVKRKPIGSVALNIYVIYIIWIVIGLSYSAYPMYGFRVLLKYLYPILVMIIASAVVRHPETFLKAGFGARLIAIISIIVFFIPGLKNVFPGVFWYGTASAINYIAICIFSLALYYHGGKDWKDLFFTGLFMLPCILWGFRTSIMGTTLALIIFFFFRYKIKSLPIIVGVLLLFTFSIFFIPSIKEKMFNKDKSLTQLQSKKISIDDIDSNGRFAMWEWSLKRFFNEKELIGSGTGNLQGIFYTEKHPFLPMRICHNDYVQIICDSGIIGLILFGGSFITLIGHCFRVYQNKQYAHYIHICAIVAASSATGMLLTMYTDNVINYSMATLSYPCGFYGMMLGLIEESKKNKNAI